MGKLKMTKEGYIFVSESGIEYDLYEGLSIGAPKRYTSDILFIVFDLYDAEKECVWFMYGATFLDDGDEYALDLINRAVNEWEQEHQDLVLGIKNGTIEHC